MATKMKQIGEHTVWSETDESLVIQISGRGEPWQRGMLLVWIAMWMACGVGVIWWVTNNPADSDMRIVAFVYTGFWIYYLIRVVKALLWRTWGRELIKVTADRVQLKRDVKGYGKAHSYFNENISNLQVIEKKDRSFGVVYSRSFWVTKGETLSFQNISKTIRFANQVEPDTADQIKKLMKRKMKG